MAEKSFDICWYDLKRSAQRRLLNNIFGAKPIVSMTFDTDHEIVCDCETFETDISCTCDESCKSTPISNDIERISLEEYSKDEPEYKSEIFYWSSYFDIFAYYVVLGNEPKKVVIYDLGDLEELIGVKSGHDLFDENDAVGKVVCIRNNTMHIKFEIVKKSFV